MKATVITIYDSNGNEIKNVSTEIVCNGEIYDKRIITIASDYPNLKGKWVKYQGRKVSSRFTNGNWYKVVGDVNEVGFVIDDRNVSNGFHSYNERYFDLTNPLPYNPNTVVGLKELPKDGKTYAECLEDVIHSDKIRMIKGLFYEMRDGEIFNHENDNSPQRGFVIKSVIDDFTAHFRIHTPPTKPIWETCRADMWEYDSTVFITTFDGQNSHIEQDDSLDKLTKHLNALAYLSEVARRCNGDRVVEWGDSRQIKYSIGRYENSLCLEITGCGFTQIAFLDKAARDGSSWIDKPIWNDYFGIPNEQ